MKTIKASKSTKVRLLYAVSFLDLFACSLAIPLLSSHLRSLGASHFTIGVLNSLYAGLQLLSGPVIGSWSDIHGYCFVLQTTLCMCSVLYFVMGATTSMPVIMLTRIGLGTLKHTQALCRALLADLVPAKDQLVTQSRLVSFAAVGFILGPALGGHLAEIENGFFYVCLIVMLFFWGNYGIVYFCLSDLLDNQGSSECTDSQTRGTEHQLNGFCQFPTWLSNYDRRNFNNQFSVLKSSTKKVYYNCSHVVKNLSHVDWPVYWDVFALKFILSFALAVHFQNFSHMLKDMYEVSPKWIGYTISLQGFVSACTGFTTHWISRFYRNDKSNFRRTLHGFGIMFLSFVLLSVAPSLTLVILLLIPLSAAGSTLRITTSEIMLQRTPPNLRGSLIGSSQSMASVARLLAPLCSGIAYDTLGFHGMSILKIASATTGIVLTNYLAVKQRQHKKRS